MTSAAGWLAEQAGQPDYYTYGPALARALAERDDARVRAEEQRAEAEKQIAREDRQDAMLFAQRQLGNPLGELSRSRAAFETADDECRELAAKLAKAEAKRNRAQNNIEFWAQRAQQATGLAQRSAPSGDGVEAAASRAQAAMRHALAEQRVDALLKRAVMPVTRRPKGRGGLAVRSDSLPEVTCADCIKYGATWEESWLLHNDPAPAPVPDAWTPADGVTTERSKVNDLVALGYSRATAELACQEIRR